VNRELIELIWMVDPIEFMMIAKTGIPIA